MEAIVQQHEWVTAFLMWGGLLVFLGLTLFPFFLLRWERLKPTRWFHVLGAYALSLLILAMGMGVIYFLNRTSFLEFVLAGFMMGIIITPVFWPFAIFFCVVQIYGDVTGGVFWVSWILFLLLCLFSFFVIGYIFEIGLGLVSNELHSFNYTEVINSLDL